MCQELWVKRIVHRFIVLNAYFMGASFIKAGYFLPVRMHVSIWFALKTYYALHFSLLLYSYQEWVFEGKKTVYTHTHSQSGNNLKALPITFPCEIFASHLPNHWNFIRSAGFFFSLFLFFFQWDELTREQQQQKWKGFFPRCATCKNNNKKRSNNKRQDWNKRPK